MRLPTHLLDGPAPRWPRPLDAALEWWATLSGRARVALRAVGAVLVVIATTGGLLEGRWGPPAPVLVAAHDVPAGRAVSSSDVAVVRWPRDLLPDEALVAVDQLPMDAVADGRLGAGTPITAGALGSGGPAASAVPGTAVVPVPADTLPTLPIGTQLDLAVASPDGTAVVVATAATVVADDGTWRWLRVTRDEVESLARGVSDARLVAAVLPPPRDGGP